MIGAMLKIVAGLHGDRGADLGKAVDVLYMIKRRAKRAVLPHFTRCHTFRVAGITAYLQNGGTLEYAQQIAAHQSPCTTKLCDRTKDEMSLDEIERVKF